MFSIRELRLVLAAAIFKNRSVLNRTWTTRRWRRPDRPRRRPEMEARAVARRL